MNDKILIVNSDDFGLSESVNTAIVAGYESGCISSTTLMASMPGFEDAVEKAHKLTFLKNSVGLHMNLTQGIPLTEKIKQCPRFFKDGYFAYDRKKPIFFLSPDEIIAIYDEITAQLNRLLKNNITPTHFDSHHHVHTELGVFNVYMAVAREHGIHKVRLTKNIGKTSPVKQVYKTFFNTYSRLRFAMTTTDIFCSANEYATIRDTPIVQGKNIEVMVHAKLTETGEVVDIDGINLESKMKPLLVGKTIVSYEKLK